jgi:PAS domain S-box-containing protein
MTAAGQPSEENVRVLLLVTTRKDAEITGRLLNEVGLLACPCESLEALRTEMAQGACALLMTEESVVADNIQEVATILKSPEALNDIPTVLLTKGGARSAMASALLLQLPNLTILERPAPVNSIVSAVLSAVRTKARQREMVRQIARTKELQSQLELALEASELGTFHCPMPLGEIIWNDRCKAHFGLPPEAKIDINLFYSLIHPEDRERTRLAVEACVSDRQRYDIEYRTVTATGTRWIRATGQTSFDEAGQPVRFSGTTQDITLRKKLEQERSHLLESERAARVAGERANRLKDEFLATLSHELRTPLNAILGWVELLKQESDDPATIQEGLAVIDRNVRVQAQLIDDLLDVSRIISGKVRLDTQPLDLSEVVRAAIDTVRPAAQAKGVSLEPIIHHPAPLITGDFGRLQQVVWNLLTNAVKFTPRNGKVQLILDQTGSNVCLSVTDTGEGIDPEFLPHVFERFRQADGSPSRNHGGLGLGLSIVKSLVELHGGRVSVASEGRGRGASFNLSFPIRIIKPAPARPSGAGTNFDPPSPLPGERPDLTGVKVLVVDDEADARGMMRRLLLSCRAISAEAPSADAATRLLQEFQPNLILSDIGMPGTDGYQFIQEVRRRGVTVPAVALTAFARSEDRVRSIQAGFQAHLSKPIEPAELLALVASLSGRMGTP